MNEELNLTNNYHLSRNNNSNDLEGIAVTEEKNSEFESTSTDFEQNLNDAVEVAPKVIGIKPNVKRAEIAQILIWTVLGIEVVEIGSSFLQIVLLNAVQNGEEVTETMIASNDLRVQLVAITYTMLFVISIFTFIQWFRRAYYNLNLRTNCVYGEGWAAGGWFIPFMNLVRPYRIMTELDTKTSNLINVKSTNTVENNTFLIGLWWTLWIIGNFASKILTRRNADSDTIEGLLESTKIDMGLAAFFIPLSIVTVLMIKSYAKKEEMLCELEISR